MRKNLQILHNKKIRVRGKVHRFGKKPPNVTTICLTDIYDMENHFLTSHVWISQGKRVEDLQVGDIVEFNAIVKPYRKANKTYDFRLSYPSQIEKVNRVWRA